MTLGEKILALRKARGWSQEDLAGRIGVTRQALSRWESDAAVPDTVNRAGSAVAAPAVLGDAGRGNCAAALRKGQKRSKRFFLGADA